MKRFALTRFAEDGSSRVLLTSGYRPMMDVVLEHFVRHAPAGVRYDLVEEDYTPTYGGGKE